MGRLITPQTWGTRPVRHPIPRDGWEPVLGELITPPFAKTGWNPPGLISLAEAADLIGTTYDVLTGFALQGKFQLTHHDGVFFMDRALAEHVRAYAEAHQEAQPNQ